MSDNIIIGVHGQAQTLEGINGINAKEVTGESTNYVPENTLMVGGKTIIENGTYNAGDDNMIGYKRVVVMDLASEGQTKAYHDTRKHNAMIACGGRQRVFSGVKKLCVKDTDDMNYIVVPSPALRTKSLSVSHPGVYDVSSETDADVYTPVYVSVSDSERDAAGFNPENPTWQDNLPDEIRVTTPPTKTEYNEGEEIDYTGMVVTAYKDGDVWSNANYPNGVIPFEELTIYQTRFDSHQMTFCWGDTLTYKNKTFPSYAPIIAYYVDDKVEIKQYYPRPSYGVDYFTRTFTYDKPVYYIYFNTQDQSYESALSIKEQFEIHGEACNGYSDQYGFGPLIVCSEPFTETTRTISYKENGDIYEDSSITTNSHSRYVAVEKNTNKIWLFAEEPSDPENYSSIEPIYFNNTNNFYYNMWYKVDINGNTTDICLNQYLDNNIVDMFRISAGLDRYSGAQVFGYILLYGGNTGLGIIGWNRPGDGLLLKTICPRSDN